MNHEHHHNHSAHPEKTPPIEYVKFGAIIAFILVVSLGYSFSRGSDLNDFLRIFMSVFFFVFAFFKLFDISGFVESYVGYDIIAKRSKIYAYAYPFIELGLGFGYLFSLPGIDWVTLFFMTIGSIGVFKALRRKSNFKCACLGTFVKLPLTTVSLVEDVAMGLMALYFIIF